MPLRYAILYHTGQSGVADHFDVLFETAPGSVLRAFRSNCWPIDRPTELRKLPDHRRIYLEYEGPVSGGRGSVHRVAGGECEVRVLDEDHIEVAIGSPATIVLLLRRSDDAQWRADVRGGGQEPLACGSETN